MSLAGFVQVLESWKSYGFAFYDFKGPEKFGNTAQYEKFKKIYIPYFEVSVRAL